MRHPQVLLSLSFLHETPHFFRALRKGCTTARTFGCEGDKNASFCAVHKQDGMVNIKGRRCNVPNCQHRPGFAMPGEKRGKYCATHRQPGMIDVVRCVRFFCFVFRVCDTFSGDTNVGFASFFSL